MFQITFCDGAAAAASDCCMTPAKPSYYDGITWAGDDLGECQGKEFREVYTLNGTLTRASIALNLVMYLQLEVSMSGKEYVSVGGCINKPDYTINDRI